MKKKILLTMAIVAAIAVAGCGGDTAETSEAAETQAPVAQTEAAAPTEEPLAPIIAGDTQAAAGEAADAGTGAFPTGVPLNQDAYTEFSEPVMYEVIEDCITWSGNDVQTSGGDLVQGSIVNAVAEDGNYLILDDQRVVEASHLQLFE